MGGGAVAGAFRDSAGGDAALGEGVADAISLNCETDKLLEELEVEPLFEEFAVEAPVFSEGIISASDDSRDIAIRYIRFLETYQVHRLVKAAEFLLLFRRR
jgi:hypothetical protein